MRRLDFVLLLLALGCGTANVAQLAARDEALSQSALMSTVRILASPAFAGRKPGSTGGDKAQAYLSDAFTKAGLQPLPGVGYRQKLRAGANVLGLFPGEGPRANEIVLVGAHFDHLGRRGDDVLAGANDNASGVAALLGTLRAFVADPPSPRRAVLFAAFDGEEGGLLGSKQFVEDPRIDLSSIVAVVILDMVGTRPHEAFGDKLVVLGSETSPEMQALVDGVPVAPGFEAVRIGLHVIEDFPTPHAAVWSDYGPFRDLGIPFAFLSSGMAPTYHQPTDTAESLTPSLLLGSSRWAAELVRRAATVLPRPTFVGSRVDLAEDLRQVTRLVRAALDPAAPLRNSLVRTERLEADLAALEGLQKRATRGVDLQPEEVVLIRRAAIRVSCYCAGPGSPMSSLCNAF